MTLKEQLGNIDIYLLDQILKGHFVEGQSILDAGCGSGRNLVYFLQHNFNVYGIDQSLEAIQRTRKLAKRLKPELPEEHFRCSSVENLDFEEASFDVVLCNAVLHFAQSVEHFEAMLAALWRVLKPQGRLFVRLASDIGIEKKVNALGNGQFLLPDGSVRFLVNEAMLIQYTQQLGGTLTEYIKTTNVQGLRCMTTWCLQK